MSTSWAPLPDRGALRWAIPVSAAAMGGAIVWLAFTSGRWSLASALTFLLPAAVIAVFEHGGEAPTVTITVETGERTATVHVADDGPGVPDDRKNSIFEMAEYGPGGGAGLGLFLVRSIVDRYGGDVRVADVDPSGARFSIRFPGT